MYERFLKLCTARGLTIKQVCDILLISPSTVSQWKRRDCLPRGEQAVRIAQYFGVTTDYILGASQEAVNVTSLSEIEYKIIFEVKTCNESEQADVLQYTRMLKYYHSLNSEIGENNENS